MQLCFSKFRFRQKTTPKYFYRYRIISKNPYSDKNSFNGNSMRYQILQAKQNRVNGRKLFIYVLDNEYLKLAKQNEATSKENVQLHKRVDDLRKQNSDYAEKCQTTAQDPDNATQKVEELTQTPEAKKPTQKVTKSEYSEQDQARIREEMKSAGMKPKAKKRRPVDDED